MSFIYCQNHECGNYLGSLGSDECNICGWKNSSDNGVESLKKELESYKEDYWDMVQERNRYACEKASLEKEVKELKDKLRNFRKLCKGEE